MNSRPHIQLHWKTAVSVRHCKSSSETVIQGKFHSKITIC